MSAYLDQHMRRITRTGSRKPKAIMALALICLALMTTIATAAMLTAPQVKGDIRATSATFQDALDCFSKCRGTVVPYDNPPKTLAVPFRFSDLLKTAAWKTKFLQMLGDMPPEYMSYGALKPGEYEGLTMSGSVNAVVSYGGKTLYIYKFVGLPEGLPPRRPTGSLDVVVDPQDGKMAGIWNGPSDISQFRFLGSPEKLAPLIAYSVAGNAEMEKADKVSRTERPAPVVLPIPEERLSYTRARLDYLSSLLANGEINGAHSPFYAGEQARAAEGTGKPKWYAIELNRKYCIDGLSPATQITMMRDAGHTVRTQETNDNHDKLVKVEMSYSEGVMTVTRTAFTSKAACEAEVARANFIPNRYK